MLTTSLRSWPQDLLTTLKPFPTDISPYSNIAFGLSATHAKPLTTYTSEKALVAQS